MACRIGNVHSHNSSLGHPLFRLLTSSCHGQSARFSNQSRKPGGQCYTRTDGVIKYPLAVVGCSVDGGRGPLCGDTTHTAGENALAMAGRRTGNLARSLGGVIEFGTFHLFHSFTSALSALVIADAPSTSIHSDAGNLQQRGDHARKFLQKKVTKGSSIFVLLPTELEMR